MAWLLSKALELAGHFRVRLIHASEPMWGQNSRGLGNGCPSCEATDGKLHWARMAHQMFIVNDAPPLPPPAAAP